MKRKTMRKAVVLWLLLALGCCTAGSPPPPSPSPSPWPTPTPLLRLALRSPDGVTRAHIACGGVSGMIYDCAVYFPNGTVMKNKRLYEFEQLAHPIKTAPIFSNWSPDGRYTIVCIGATHDSPCGWWEIWDSVSGEVKHSFYSYTSGWAPGYDHTHVYLSRQNCAAGEEEFVSIDPATGEKIVFAEWPDWLRAEFGHSASVYRPCSAQPGGDEGRR